MSDWTAALAKFEMPEGWNWKSTMQQMSEQMKMFRVKQNSENKNEGSDE